MRDFTHVTSRLSVDLFLGGKPIVQIMAWRECPRCGLEEGGLRDSCLVNGSVADVPPILSSRRL
jgi:hypothetical protein